MKDLECVKSYVDSKREEIIDTLISTQCFDFLLTVIQHYEIAMDWYKGDITILPKLYP